MQSAEQQTNNAADLNVDLTQFESVLMDDQSSRGKLWRAWHFIQVYSTWAVRIPSSTNDLSDYLKIPAGELANYSFFASKQEAYATIHDSAHFAG